MIFSAVKRNIEETEYKQHAGIDNGRGTDNFGRPLNRLYQVGDRFFLPLGWVEITETFEGFDFHSNEPVHCFNVKSICSNCGGLYSGSDEYRANHSGYYGFKCSKKEGK